MALSKGLGTPVERDLLDTGHAGLALYRAELWVSGEDVWTSSKRLCILIPQRCESFDPDWSKRFKGSGLLVDNGDTSAFLQFRRDALQIHHLKNNLITTTAKDDFKITGHLV